MKKLFIICTVFLSISACSSTPNKDVPPPKIGMPNPASQYCIEQGGQLEMKRMVRSDTVNYRMVKL